MLDDKASSEWPCVCLVPMLSKGLSLGGMAITHQTRGSAKQTRLDFIQPQQQQLQTLLSALILQIFPAATPYWMSLHSCSLEIA